LILHSKFPHKNRDQKHVDIDFQNIHLFIESGAVVPYLDPGTSRGTPGLHSSTLGKIMRKKSVLFSKTRKKIIRQFEEKNAHFEKIVPNFGEHFFNIFCSVDLPRILIKV